MAEKEQVFFHAQLLAVTCLQRPTDFVTATAASLRSSQWRG